MKKPAEPDDDDARADDANPLRRYAPFYTALACGFAALAATLWFWAELAVQIPANVFFIVYLILEYMKFRRLTPAFLKKHAASTDEPAWVIVAVTFAAVVVSVGSLFLLLNSGRPGPAQLVLSLTSVALGWATIPTMAAVHYAHLYWRPDDEAPEGSGTHGGLDFPGDNEPGGSDFLYYSMVIAMTAQTADIGITKTAMRKLTMLHSVVSFFFNTVLVAAAVNVAVSLASN